ncbi:hypothetical protein SteCoe_33396 [Stentor coeruleus]|uniref:Uncharacterized protein n=1 Tax=Stentor coeruleus TaxID=5963 RepID=A0A1R2AWW6_9CILI|nr:hypothetical protein SteCoe_33396 [Stentor coeruleus]
MEEAILNSLLRYSNQLTPSRDTYPIPSKNWTSALRTSAPEINYSTYYLLDNPALSNSPNRLLPRINSSASTSAISPQKRFSNLSPSKQPIQSLRESPPKIPQIEDIKKMIEKDRLEKPKLFKNSKQNESPNKNHEDKKPVKSKNAESIRKEFEEYKREQEQRENMMKGQIEELKEMLKQSNEVIKAFQQKQTII